MINRFSLLSAVCLVSTIGCAKPGSAKPEGQGPSEAQRSRPSYLTADLPDDPTSHIPGAIVVDFKDGTTKAEFDEYEKAWGVDLELVDDEEGPDSAITVGGFGGSEDEEAALLARIRADPHVEAAEPLMKLTASCVPNDPLFEKQWNLKMINMPKAWDTTRGKGVVVAVLDTGIAWENHDDFVRGARPRWREVRRGLRLRQR